MERWRKLKMEILKTNLPRHRQKNEKAEEGEKKKPKLNI